MNASIDGVRVHMSKRELAYWRQYKVTCTLCGGLGDTSYRQSSNGDDCPRCGGTGLDPQPSVIVTSKHPVAVVTVQRRR